MKLPLCLALVALITSVAPAPASQDAARPALQHYNLDKRGVALSGYDPVSYFEAGGGKPTKGSGDLLLTHAGITYRFASEANRAAFEASPETFEPAYGGWCAYAMAKGDKVEVDPKSFLIEDGKLLLFYKGLLNDTRKKWTKQGPENLAPAADAQWSKLVRTRDLTHFNLSDALALSGFDPVSYFEGAPARGESSNELVQDGVRYRFASAANRASFEQDPQRFEAAYGGYCAWAMAQGKKVEVDPTAYAITDGRLMLFYNAEKRDEWGADTERLEAQADEQWRQLHAPK